MKASKKLCIVLLDCGPFLPGLGDVLECEATEFRFMDASGLTEVLSPSEGLGNFKILLFSCPLFSSEDDTRFELFMWVFVSLFDFTV